MNKQQVSDLREALANRRHNLNPRDDGFDKAELEREHWEEKRFYLTNDLFFKRIEPFISYPVSDCYIEKEKSYIRDYLLRIIESGEIPQLKVKKAKGACEEFYRFYLDF